MSVSQFDDDFGESTSPSTKAGSNDAYDYEFDPFGGQNITADAKITNGSASNGLDFEIDNTSTAEPTDQHHNMSDTNGPSNQLLDIESGSENPHDEENAGQPSSHDNEDLPTHPQSDKPLFETDNDEPVTEEADLIGEFSEQQQDDSSHAQASLQQDDDTDLLGDFEVLQKEDIVEQQYDAGNLSADHEQLTVDPSQHEEQQFQDVHQDYPEPEERVEEAGTGDASTEEAQIEDATIEEAQIEVAPLEDTPVEDVVVEDRQIEDDQIDEAPLEEAPVEYSQFDEAPVEEAPVEDAPVEDASVEDAPVEDAPVEDAPVEDAPVEEAPVEVAAPEADRYLPIPDVEITESPEQDFSEHEDNIVDIKTEPIVDIETREDVEEVEATVGGEATEEAEAPSVHAVDIEHDILVAENFGHDRREKDLEHYCMDREESDLMEEHEIVPEPQMDSLKLREQRSRSPSRSIGPDTQDEPERREPSETPETDTLEEADTLRPRDDRSHAPSRSLEPEDKPQAEDSTDSGFAGHGQTVRENRDSDAGSDRAQISADHTPDQWSGEGSHQHVEKQDATHSEALPATGEEPQNTSELQGEDDEEEGVYENEPTKRGDVCREADTDRTADLPASGTAHSLREKFLIAQQEAAAPTRSKREITPPVHGAGGEYVSEPRGFVERYEGKADSGVFESQPVVKDDVITSNTHIEEARVESGFAKNTAAKFKELQNKSTTPSGKKELTPDRTGRVEYVSEPRGQLEQYEGRSESGVFESEPVLNPDVVRSGEEVKEELPERGTARNLADKFRQIGSDTAAPSARGKREITPDRSGRVEYVSEPRGQHAEDYEIKVDAGVFENQPQRNADVITSDTVAEEVVPERGYARNVAAKFKELETTVKSPPLSPGRRKEFTPPREDERFHQAGVIESTPDFKSDVIHAGDHLEEALPERGTAKNMAQKFRQLETESKTPGSFKAKKEFTPPPGDTGVYENQPQQFHADYNRPPESGIIENQPLRRDDVVRGDEPPKYEVELPERGAAKNLVNKWKQLESEGSKVKSPGSTGRQKEFTPPREEPRIAEQRKSPRTPISPSGNGELDNGSVHPSDLPGQYQPQNEPTIFESSPQQRSDVLREADADWTEGMPKKDTAKKMLAKFQNIQAEANKQSPGPVSRKETETPRKTPRKDSTCSDSDSEHIMENEKQNLNLQEQVGRSKSMRAAIQAEKCGACEKTVYAMERLEMNKRVYHKACFRCTHCKAVLTPKTFAINNEVIFCTTHYKQLFATKGNYDEGFGRSQHKKRWNSNPDLSKDVDENDLS